MASRASDCSVHPPLVDREDHLAEITSGEMVFNRETQWVVLEDGSRCNVTRGPCGHPKGAFAPPATLQVLYHTRLLFFMFQNIGRRESAQC